MIKRWILLSLLPSLVLGEDSSLTDLTLSELMEVELTSASKKTEKLSEVAAAVYVVTNEEISRSGATSIPEALRLVPGVDVAQTDPNKWAVSIRGFNGRFANKLLVMVDGRTVYTPTFSGVYWENLDYLLADINRIEVIRGPGATLWGANAVNGIINIITKDTSDTQGGLAELALGNKTKGLVNLRQGVELSPDALMRVYTKLRKVDGAESLAGNGQDNGGEYIQAGFKLGWQISDSKLFTLQGDGYHNKMAQEHLAANFSPPYLPHKLLSQEDIKGGNIMAKWEQLHNLNSQTNLQFYFDYYDREEVKFHDELKTFDLDFQHRLTLFEHHDLIFGLGYRWTANRVKPGLFVVTPEAKFNRSKWNGFVQDEISFPNQRLRLIIGSKLEWNDYTGYSFQPGVRASWQPSDHLTWWSAISRAERSASYGEQEYSLNVNSYPPFALSPANPLPTLIQVQGQQDFKPEVLDAYELGGRWLLQSNLSLDIAAFYNKYKNLRSYRMGQTTLDTSFSPPFVNQPLILANNISGHSQGVEILSNWQVNTDTRIRLVYSYLQMSLEDSEQVPGFSDDIISMNTDRSPKHQASIWSSLDILPELELDARVFYIAERSWKTNPSHYIEANFNADLRLSWQVNQLLSVSVTGCNLIHQAKQEFVTETWASPSLIERSLLLNAQIKW